jgi:hypothetical protein
LLTEQCQQQQHWRRGPLLLLLLLAALLLGLLEASVLTMAWGWHLQSNAQHN